MDEFWFRLLFPQEFEAFEVCRVFWTWYIGIRFFLPLYSRTAPSYESPTHIISGLLIGMIITAAFFFLLGYTLFSVQNLLPLVHSPFIATVIILFNVSLPFAIGAKVKDVM